MTRSIVLCVVYFFFFFNDTATTEIYTLSLHDALPIFTGHGKHGHVDLDWKSLVQPHRSEEHTSELQSRFDLVCRLLLEKKKKNMKNYTDRQIKITAHNPRLLCQRT